MSMFVHSRFLNCLLDKMYINSFSQHKFDKNNYKSYKYLLHYQYNYVCIQPVFELINIAQALVITICIIFFESITIFVIGLSVRNISNKFLTIVNYIRLLKKDR